MNVSLRVLENRYVELRSMADGSLLRTAAFNGIDHLVVPIVTAVGDNVWWPANAPTPELVPASVLAAHAFSRNNRPVVMGHPKSGGDYVSANDPKILQEYAFGQMFASEFKDGRIVVEAWLDPVRAAAVGPDAVDVIDRLRAGKQVEVSEGDFVVTVAESGEVNGKKYGARWVSAVSDHLAMLRADEVGACDNKMGCGGPRVSVLRSNMSGLGFNDPVESATVIDPGEAPAMRFSALSQARTPTYTGTESVKWYKPSFADFVKYLDNSSEPPKTVSQCSTSMKADIASHSLLGDPSASSFSDMSTFCVVNPANGKLNERALRGVLAGRGSSGEISDSALASAQEIARRLLNSEFSASITASEVSMKESIFKRMAAKIKSAMSNNDLRWKLYKAISALEPGVEYVDDEDTEAGTVRYVVMIRFGDSWDSNSETQYHYYQRTFTTDTAGAVTVNDDRIELIYDEQSAWQPKPSDTPDDPSMVLATATSCGCPDKTNCSCPNHEVNENKGENNMKPNEAVKNLASRLITSSASPFEESDRATLEGMSEDKLGALASKFAEASAAVPAAVAVAEPVPAVTASAASAAATQPGQRILTETEYAALKTAADAFQSVQQARRTHLVSSLKTACGNAFTEADLQALDTPVLEKLAASHRIDVPAAADFSLRGIPQSSLTTSEADKINAHKPKDTWALALAAKNKREGRQSNDDGKAN